ncbi:MAG: hypothetical protein A2X81_06430 [Desulfobacterales bacterium GWB2_56_26]|nr:MAG: hypothetical protein A2X81_06430 [Desulfobacterales bacterium GWB2_56_26]
MTQLPKIVGKRNWFLRLRPVLRWVLKLRSSPRAIAGGLGVGMFIAFTPTVGLQVILALIAATICNVNRPAAIVPVWITNPVTVAPVYTFNYWLGTFFYPGPPLSEVSKVFTDIGRALATLDVWDLKEPVVAMLQMGKEILIPLTIGSIAVGIVLGILTYIFSLKLLSFFFRRRAQRQLLNNKPEQRKDPSRS